MKSKHPAPPTQSKSLRLTALFTLSLFALNGLAQTSAPATPPAEETIELSPFVVTAESDVGYTATSSLAGSRLNTPLKDTGATINILTAEFLQDLGAFDLDDALAYAGNVQEDQDYDSGGNANAAFFNFRNFKVRGLPATKTRNYFNWDLATDNYNVERVEEQRGPNSILFGIGSSGGVINSSTKRALTGRSFKRVTLVGGDYDTYRGTFDVNQASADKRFAVRLNGVYSHAGSFKLFKFNETRRLHLASTFVFTPNTQLSVDAEAGKIDQVTGRNNAVIDGISTWVDKGSQLVNAPVTAGAALTAAGLARYPANAVRLTYFPQTGQAFNMKGRNFSAGTTYDILDQSIADFSINTAGPGSLRTGDLKNVTVMLDHKFGKSTYAQLSGNFQQASTLAYIMGQGRFQNNTLYADPNNFLPDGTPNPHAGQMFFEGDRWNRNDVDTKSRNLRVTVSHELDLGKWGNYRFALLGEKEWRDRHVLNETEVWAGAPFNATPENQANAVYRRNYVTPGQWDTYNVWGAAYSGLAEGVPDPTNPTRTLSSTWVPFNGGTPQNSPDTQTTGLVGLQARYLKNRLIVGLGYRKDRLESESSQSVRDPVTQLWTLDSPDVVVTREVFNGDTRTLGLVGHLTNRLSVFYNFSNTLGLPTKTIRILPDNELAPGPTGEGQDYGFAFELVPDRLTLRASRFVTDLKNGSATGHFGGTATAPSVYSDNILDAFLRDNIIAQAEADAHRINQNGSTFNEQVEGYEVSLVGNVTKNWRASLQYSYTDGYNSDIAPEVKAWAATELPYFLQHPDVQIFIGEAAPIPVSAYVAQWQANADIVFRSEGISINGMRRHKVAFFTRYSFSDGPLKGLFIGGGHRYQSRMVLGVTPDYQILYGNSRWYSDLLLGYQIRKFAFLKHGVRLQLNVNNLFNRTEPTEAAVRPGGPDGEYITYRARLVDPRRWRLSASFDF